MRKFKVKNRQKRKYVKKQELAASFSHVYSLTLGIIPVLLMAIAFFTTFLISNPQYVTLPIQNTHLGMPAMPVHLHLPKITLPSLDLASSMPRVNFSFDMPTFSLPTVAIPELPQFTIPNVMPSLTASLFTGVQALGAGGNWLLMTGGYAAAVLDPRPLLSSTGSYMITAAQQASSAAFYGFSTTGQFIGLSAAAVWTVATNVSYTIGQLISHAMHTIFFWIETAFTTIIDAWNAFLWFIGTPFRAIRHTMDETAIALAPFFNAVSYYLGQATEELRTGGNNLIQSTNYVTTTVSDQK
jgi:hypothetical protein